MTEQYYGRVKVPPEGENHAKSTLILSGTPMAKIPGFVFSFIMLRRE